MFEVFTEAWARAWCEALNRDEVYARVARTWEGSLVLLMEPDPRYGIEAPRGVWVDLWHGRCREARPLQEGDLERARYVLQGPAAVWYAVLSGELGPIPALIRGQLRLVRGNLMGLLPYVRAAQRLVAVAVAIGTYFPRQPQASPSPGGSG